jgi:3-hydroxybutyryl-CoA dehydrogenase
MTGRALPVSAKVGVIGAGTMGAGIAQVAAAAGHQVFLFDVADGAVEKGLANTASGLDKLVERGRMDAGQRDVLLARIHRADALEELSQCALVVEAIVEKLDVKQELFKKLETICAADTILASNTSSLSITAIGAALAQPGRLVGMHFFNPAPVMKLVEIVSGLDTDSDVAMCIYDTATAWGKHAVHARSTPGFIVNRVARPFYGEALRLLEEGIADAATIDQVVREGGAFRMGPFELMDLIGIDINYAVSCSVYDAFYQEPRFAPSLLQKERVDAGRLGRKSSRGFYDYADTAEPMIPVTARPTAAPESATVGRQHGLLVPLVERIKHAGIAVHVGEDTGTIHLPDAVLALTDGRSATRRAFEDEHDNLVLFDLTFDFATATGVSLAAASNCNTQGLAQATGLLQAAGLVVYPIADTPGLIVMRLVSMLINEAAEAVLQGVCDARGVDVAMQSGVNYPRGPLAWADLIGAETVFTVLNHLQQSYGSDRYRPSLLLQQHVYAARPFHEKSH